MTDSTLKQLRAQLTDCDREIIELIARRQSLVAGIGQQKRHSGKPTRDYRRETVVFDNARRAANEFGVDGSVAHEIIARLIRYSLSRQESFRARASAHGEGQNALIIGGLGKMGAWFADFLENQHFVVEIADPGSANSRFPLHPEWRELELDHYDLILVATPLAATLQTLMQLSKSRPRGVIMDIASVKSPLQPAYAQLRAAGCQVVGIHPMYGPDARLLADKHLIVVDVGCPPANRLAHALFAPTMVRVVDMELDRHDRQIAWLLGLSHALNICFFTALSRSGRRAGELANSSSTTFESQLELAAGVAAESAALYFEIQHANPYNGQALTALSGALEELQKILASSDRDQFVTLMHAGREYLAAHAQARLCRPVQT